MKAKPLSFSERIRASGLSIYDPIEIGSALWIPAAELEQFLDRRLRQLDLAYALRTRSKMAKAAVCEALGYPVPESFQRTRPRFPGQGFDIYVQKANNLQVWNEDLSPTRRYVLIRVNELSRVTGVKVVTGDVLAELDTTGVLTQKYQARFALGKSPAELISRTDTDRIVNCVGLSSPKIFALSPSTNPTADCLLPIREIFHRIRPLLDTTLHDPGVDQERNRGSELHRAVSRALGYVGHSDDGQFPDIKHQLLEIKLQTAMTIDLGLITPSSDSPLDIPQINGVQLRHCDVRYALFYARKESENRTVLTHFYLTTGKDFFLQFPRCEGRVLNRKLQIRLPSDFFDR